MVAQDAEATAKAAAMRLLFSETQVGSWWELSDSDDQWAIVEVNERGTVIVDANGWSAAFSTATIASFRTVVRERLKLVASADDKQLVALCKHRCAETWVSEVALSDIDALISDTKTFGLFDRGSGEHMRKLEELRKVVEIGSYNPFAVEFEVRLMVESIGLDRVPGICPHHDIITARAIVRRLVTLLEAAP